MKSSAKNIVLKSVDDIFQTEENRADAQRERVQEIPLDQLKPFKNHPFKVRDDQRMLDTVDSIREYGVLVPAIARPDPEGGYELISGHRRKRGCEMAGLQTMPVIIRNLDDDAAVLVMVDSNIQREELLPSERAFAYKMKLEALKHQGARSDLTSMQVAQKLSVQKVGEDAGVSKDQVRRFIRLTELISELLDMVDERKLAFNPAVEVSYLKRDEQQMLLEAMDADHTVAFAGAAAQEIQSGRAADGGGDVRHYERGEKERHGQGDAQKRHAAQVFSEVVYAQADGADHHQAVGRVAETAAEKSGTIKGCLEAVQERGRQKILIEKDLFGTVRDKVKIAQERLKAFEPSEGYYVADSGGKDSACVLALCKMAGVRFDSHYNITTVDPPELVEFVREAHPETELVRPQMTMRELIVKKQFPPTRIHRYCCAELKETQGSGRIVVTGVRWAESANRRKKRGLVNIGGAEAQVTADGFNADYKKNKYGIILNSDNVENRKTVEHCVRQGKIVVNPIIDWEDSDVWSFLRSYRIPYCKLYDCGIKRLGCVCCPLGGSAGMQRDLRLFPQFRKFYTDAFERMLQARRMSGKKVIPEWDGGESVLLWWIGLKHLNKGNQISMFDEPALEGIVDQDELEDEAFLNGQ